MVKTQMPDAQELMKWKREFSKDWNIATKNIPRLFEFRDCLVNEWNDGFKSIQVDKIYL